MCKFFCGQNFQRKKLGIWVRVNARIEQMLIRTVRNLVWIDWNYIILRIYFTLLYVSVTLTSVYLLIYNFVVEGLLFSQNLVFEFTILLIFVLLALEFFICKCIAFLGNAMLGLNQLLTAKARLYKGIRLKFSM